MLTNALAMPKWEMFENSENSSFEFSKYKKNVQLYSIWITLIAYFNHQLILSITYGQHLIL